MVDLSLLKEVARFETDANGEEVVVIPRRMWEDVIEEKPLLEADNPEQRVRILALLDQWEREPVENMSEESSPTTSRISPKSA